MDITLIQGTIANLKLAGDIAKSLLDIKKATDVGAKVVELQSAILAAQSSALAANAAQFSMVEEIRALKEEVVRVKAWESQKERYVLHSPWSGSFVYAVKESMKGADSPHWICTACYEKGVRSILQLVGSSSGAALYRCSCGLDVRCGKSTVHIEYAPG